MKPIKTMFFSIGLGIFLVSCSNGTDCCANPDNSTIVGIGMEMSVRDENGTDLLDPQNPNAYMEEDIKLFYLIDGEVGEVFYGNLDHPRMIKIFQHENEYRIGIALNHNENENPPITYIQWSETDTDTLKAEFRRWDNGIEVRKLWFNNELKWQFSDGDTYFEIVK